MPDEFDAAQALEERYRHAAIAAVRQGAREARRPSGQEDCEACDQPIPAERLAIVPGATRCVRCQTLRDRGAVPAR
jgi:phage/conjugal plasmid C-4 type zinc finger TraR family protein